MRRSQDFLLRQVAGRQVIVPLGAAAVKFQGMMTVNNTGAYMWQLLEQEQTCDSLYEALCSRYDVAAVDGITVRADVEGFVKKLRLVGALIEE